MRKFLSVLFVLMVAMIAGPVLAGSPPVVTSFITHVGSTQAIRADGFTLEPGVFYPYECPSYAVDCTLLFGNSSDGIEVVWITSAAGEWSDAISIAIDPGATATYTASPGMTIQYSTHTETWSQGYPSSYRVDLVDSHANVVTGSSMSVAAQPEMIRRATPVRR